MLAVSLPYVAFIMWAMFPLHPLCWEFFFLIKNGYWILVELFLHLSRWSCGFMLQLVSMVYHIDWFADTEKYIHSRIKFHLNMECNLFKCIAGSSWLIFCWRFLHLCSQVVLCSVLDHFSGVWLFVTVGYSPASSSIHGILQARILEWVAVSSSSGCCGPWDRTFISYISGIGMWVLYHWCQRGIGL